MSALLFGSISTLADTSELQRESFNKAFESHGLDWQWSQDDYRSMLDQNGGQQRIAAYAASQGADVDAEAVHATKSEIFQKSVTSSSLEPRPGVAQAIDDAKAKGMKVGLVTTTSPENVAALLAALEPEVSTDSFDTVIDATSVSEPKPDKAAYTQALQALGEDAAACVAVEDNVGGVQSAAAAGIACVAFPNENTAAHDFSMAAARLDRMDIADLVAAIPAA